MHEHAGIFSALQVGIEASISSTIQMERYEQHPDRWCMLLLCRALAAANPAVRRNALQLLVDAFPLHDPDASQVPQLPQFMQFHILLVDS